MFVILTYIYIEKQKKKIQSLSLPFASQKVVVNLATLAHSFFAPSSLPYSSQFLFPSEIRFLHR